MQLTTNGIVLRDRKTEDNRLLTVLTDSWGVISAWANGANRTRSKLAASTEMLSYSSLVLFRSRDRYTVDKADSIRLFFGIREDLDKLALASYLAELTAELAPHGEASGEFLRLLLNTLHLLEKNARPPVLLKALYELRLLTMAGYMPGLVGCRSCARYEAERMLFQPRQGELVCDACVTEADAGAVFLPPAVLAAMRHIVFSGPEKLFSFALLEDSLHHLERIAEDYLKNQLEKTLPTLEFYHSLRAGRA